MAGISPQSPESHKRFREKHSLPFTLLADENKDVVKLFGVNGPLGFWVQRVTFLVDQNRMVARPGEGAFLDRGTRGVHPPGHRAAEETALRAFNT